MLKKDLGAIAWIMAICSLFIGAFMVKAIFSVRNAKPTDLHEVTAKDQPRLFAFLFDLADAGMRRVRTRCTCRRASTPPCSTTFPCST
ncbi:hypothetical protein LP419_17560 [Massilia sp. H-1]|nr:hypothetical protein LP419_17560 [Massilia sp. H-1]